MGRQRIDPPPSNIPVGLSSTCYGRDRAAHRAGTLLKLRSVIVVSGPAACGKTLLAQTVSRSWLYDEECFGYAKNSRSPRSRALPARVVFWIDAGSPQSLVKSCRAAAEQLEDYFQDELEISLKRTLESMISSSASHSVLLLTDITRHLFQLLQSLPPVLEWLVVLDGAGVTWDQAPYNLDLFTYSVKVWLNDFLPSWEKTLQSANGRGKFLLTCTTAATPSPQDAILCEGSGWIRPTQSAVEDQVTIGRLHLRAELESIEAAVSLLHSNLLPQQQHIHHARQLAQICQLRPDLLRTANLALCRSGGDLTVTRLLQATDQRGPPTTIYVASESTPAPQVTPSLHEPDSHGRVLISSTAAHRAPMPDIQPSSKPRPPPTLSSAGSDEDDEDLMEYDGKGVIPRGPSSWPVRRGPAPPRPPRSNMPAPERIFGRGVEMDRCRALLSLRRIVTVQGPSGCGKSTTVNHVGRVWQDGLPQYRFAMWVDTKNLRPSWIGIVGRLQKFFEEELGVRLQRSIRVDDPSVTDSQSPSHVPEAELAHHVVELLKCLPPVLEWIMVLDGVEWSPTSSPNTTTSPPSADHDDKEEVAWLDERLPGWRELERGRFIMTVQTQALATTEDLTVAWLKQDQWVGRVNLSPQLDRNSAVDFLHSNLLPWQKNDHDAEQLAKICHDRPSKLRQVNTLLCQSAGQETVSSLLARTLGSPQPAPIPSPSIPVMPQPMTAMSMMEQVKTQVYPTLSQQRPLFMGPEPWLEQRVLSPSIAVNAVLEPPPAGMSISISAYRNKKTPEDVTVVSRATKGTQFTLNTHKTNKSSGTATTAASTVASTLSGSSDPFHFESRIDASVASSQDSQGSSKRRAPLGKRVLSKFIRPRPGRNDVNRSDQIPEEGSISEQLQADSTYSESKPLDKETAALQMIEETLEEQKERKSYLMEQAEIYRREARYYVQVRHQRKALRSMRRLKLVQQEFERVAKAIEAMSDYADKIDELRNQRNFMQAMKSADTAMKSVQGDPGNWEALDEVMESWTERGDLAAEIGQILSRPVSAAAMNDEEDLMRELQAMM